MYKLRPTTIDELKAAIRQTVNKFLREITRRVMKTLKIVYSSVSHLEGVTTRTLFLKHCSHKMSIIKRCKDVIKIKIRVFLVYFFGI